MQTGSDLSNKVEQFIQKEKLLEHGDGVVVAVSGGPDSVGLLHLLFMLSKRWNWRLTVAHVNHGFRGEESDWEEKEVARLAEHLGLPFQSVFIDVPKYIHETGKNTQVAAREKRYAFLMDVAKQTKSCRIALAHHADDQAETVMMRILRGTGPSGLTGIPVKRMEKNGVELVRPLLRIYKSEIINYCKENDLTYCIDSSNLQTKYVRNQIRSVVLPFLSRYNEQLPSSLNRLTEMMAAENDYLDKEAERLFDQFIEKKERAYFWSAKWFATVHVALQRRLIKLILNCLATGPDAADFLNIEQIRSAILRTTVPSNFKWGIAQNITLSREYDRMALHSMFLPSLSYYYQVHQGQQELLLNETGVRVVFQWLNTHENENGLGDAYQAYFDADGISFPLIFRTRRPGDRMSPLGLNGTKKVKDIFIDAKVPPTLRNQIPIVTDANGDILWLPGIRRSSRAVCTDNTKSVLHMKLYMPGSSSSSC